MIVETPIDKRMIMDYDIDDDNDDDSDDSDVDDDNEYTSYDFIIGWIRPQLLFRGLIHR
jgi:hypothetical protein